MKVVEVSQFFTLEDMTFAELTKGEEKGVLPSTDKTCFLWGEKPKVREVSEKDTPYIGEVWYIEGKDGKPELWKANYDSSD